MNKSGKTSTIFLVVLAVFFVCTTGISVFFFLKETELRKGAELTVKEMRDTQAKLQGDLQETKKQLQLTEEKKAEAEKSVDSLKSELQVAQDLKTELQKQNKDLTDNLAAEKKNKEDLRAQLSKDLSTAEQKSTELQQKLDIISKQRDEIESRRTDLQKQYDDLKAKLDAIAAQPAPTPSPVASEAPAGDTTSIAPNPSASENIAKPAAPAKEGAVPLGTIVVNPDEGNAKSAERGKIITIDSDAEFLIVALGSKDGVKADSVLSVYHGDKYLGDVKATRVLEDMCAVDLVPPLKSQAVSKDDRVVMKQ